jgi:hypothetical protein
VFVAPIIENLLEIVTISDADKSINNKVRKISRDFFEKKISAKFSNIDPILISKIILRIVG